VLTRQKEVANQEFPDAESVGNPKQGNPKQGNPRQGKGEKEENVKKHEINNILIGSKIQGFPNKTFNSITYIANCIDNMQTKVGKGNMIGKFALKHEIFVFFGKFSKCNQHFLYQHLTVVSANLPIKKNIISNSLPGCSENTSQSVFFSI